MNERFFMSADVMRQSLLNDCMKELQLGVQKNGSASLLVSGGRSPMAFFQLLSQQDLPWQQIQIALVDERWVAADHAASNEKLVRENLLINAAAKAQFIAMKNQAEDPQAGLAQCEQAYQQLAQPFDVTLLGMGPDGHTASWFPHAQGLQQALDMTAENLVCAIEAKASAVTGEYLQRLSLNARAVLSSKSIKLCIEGATKRDVLEQAKQPGDVADMPIRALWQLTNEDKLAVYWAP